MKPAYLPASVMILLASALPGAAAVDVPATEPSAGPDVVLCLTKEFVHDASYDTFQRVSPVVRQIHGVAIRGTAATHGTAVVEFEDTVQPSSASPSKTLANAAGVALLLKVQGTTLTEAVGCQGKVRVYTVGTTRFTATKRIVFDGEKFTSLPASVEVSHYTQIGRITCPGGKFRQRLVARLGWPRMEAVRDVGDTMTRRETYQQVCAGVDLEGGHLVALLNDLSPSVQAIARLVPEQKPWRLSASARGSQVLIACGCGDYSLNSPGAFGATAQGPVQLWIRGELGPSALRDLLDGCQRINARLREDYAQRNGGKSPPADALAVQRRQDYLVIAVAPAAFERMRPEAEPKPAPEKSPQSRWAAAAPSLDKLSSRTPLHDGEPRLLDRMRRTAD